MFHSVKKHQGGFTIIELMLAMTFVSFVLVFMVLALVQMVRTYDKGLTIKQINQAGRTITEDIARTMKGEQPGKIVLTAVPDGRLCIGDVMYIWNPVYKNTVASPVVAADLDLYDFSNPAGVVTMGRIKTTTAGTNCAAPSNPIPRNQDNYSLLGDRARVLWAGVTPSPDGRLVKLTFILSTYDTNEATAIRAGQFNNMFNTPHFVSGQPTCQPGANGNYCAFADFSTTVYLPNGQ